MILYVIEFNNHLIKVGKTSRPYEIRRYEHAQGNPYLRITREYWCATDLPERKLILFCRRKGKMRTMKSEKGCAKEWFYALDFNTVVYYLKRFAIYEMVETPLPLFNSNIVVDVASPITEELAIEESPKIEELPKIKRTVTYVQLKQIMKARDLAERKLRAKQLREQMRKQLRLQKEFERRQLEIKERARIKEMLQWEAVSKNLRKELTKDVVQEVTISDWWKRV